MNDTEEEYEIGSRYWTSYINYRTNYIQILETTWKNDCIDNLRRNQGRIFKSKKDAESYVERKT